MSQGGGPAEVRIRLVVDDRATDTTEQFLESLRGGNEHLEQGKKHAEGMFGEMFKANIATELVKGSAELVAEGIKQAWEMTEHLAESSMEAADASNLQVRNLTGMMGMLDRGAHSMQEVRDYAEGVHEELELVAVKSGVATNQIVGMYQSIIERGAKSTEQARDLTEQMAVVGKVVPGGMESIAQGFSMMELGIIRARNPLVQLITTTGLLHGNAHAVAAQMQKMTPEQQIRLATAAIEKQAETLKKAGAAGVMMPTLGELRTSFEGLREIVLKSIGEPMLAHLVPMLTKLRDYLTDHLDQLQEGAERVGMFLGDLVDEVGEAVGGIYAGIQQNWAQIKSLYEEAVDMWHEAWEDADGKSVSIHDRFVSMVKFLIDAFATVEKYVRAAGEVLGDLMHPTENFGYTATTHAGARAENLADAIGPDAVKKFDEAASKFRAMAAEGGMSADKVQAEEERLARAREALMARQQWASQVQENVTVGKTDDISAAINTAVSQHDEAAEQWVLSTIASSDAMTRALMTGAIQVDGGFDSLKNVIDEQAPELARKMKALSAGIKGEGGIKGMGPQVNFYGAQFHMKNDFRDKDPDRIMQMFKSEVGKAAVSRQQSKVASFGGL